MQTICNTVHYIYWIIETWIKAKWLRCDLVSLISAQSYQKVAYWSWWYWKLTRLRFPENCKWITTLCVFHRLDKSPQTCGSCNCFCWLWLVLFVAKCLLERKALVALLLEFYRIRWFSFLFWTYWFSLFRQPGAIVCQSTVCVSKFTKVEL